MAYEKVTVVVPIRNEVKHISACLDSILQGDFPQDKLEILLVDGMSDDGTAPILQSYASKFSFIRVLANEKRSAAAAMNRGIVEANGEIIIRIDAHSVYPQHYLSRLVFWLESTGADNVGGRWEIRAKTTGTVARAISSALSCRFGGGTASYRSHSPTRWVDTVPYGCFRKEVFEKYGLYDETVGRNEDDEFNSRLIKRGGRVLLASDVCSYYYARESIWDLSRTYYTYGYFKPLVVKKVRGLFTIRQLLPPMFLVTLLTLSVFGIWYLKARFGLAALALTYGLLGAFSSVIVMFREGLACGLIAPLVFFVIHFCYGIGYLKGLLDFLILSREKRMDLDHMPLARE